MKPILRERIVVALACAALALAAVAAAGETYKWVDKDGKVHYSDKPMAGTKPVAEAEKVELKPVNEVSSTATPPPEMAVNNNEQPAEPLDSATSYTSMKITNPKAGDTIRGSGIGITIAVELNPGLGGDDKIEYLLDGKVVAQSIPYVERGLHAVSARVVDPNGQTKIEASAVTFQVFQNNQTVTTPPAKPKKP